MSEPLLIVGNGMAAARLVRELTAHVLGRYAIAMVGEEPRLAYNRVLLSSVLAGEVDAGETEMMPASWWRARGVTLLYGSPAVSVDPEIRRVRLLSGATLPYSKLVLATGSRAVTLPLPGMKLPGVLTFRDLGDVAALQAVARNGRDAVVIGGGLLGLEAAYGLAKAGMRVSIVHMMDRLMERQIDARAAALLRQAVESLGIAVHLEADTVSVTGKSRAEAVNLRNGRSLPADVVVVAVGVRPNVELAHSAGAEVGRGITVDDCLRTNVRDIHAVGECAEHRGQCYGLVEPAHEQAAVLAAHLAGDASAVYRGSILATNLKVTGVNVFSAGDFLGSPGTETIILTDPGIGLYKKLVIRDGRIVGAVLFGDTADGLWYLELIRSGQPITNMRNDLVFGRAFAQAA